MKYIGIVDALGVESFMPLDANKDKAFVLDLRAKANPQRNAIVYVLDFTEEETLPIIDLIGKQEFVEAGKIITKKLDAITNSKNTEVNEKLQEIYKIRGYL